MTTATDTAGNKMLTVTADFDMDAVASLLSGLELSNNGNLLKANMTAAQRRQIPAMVEAEWVVETPTRIYTPFGYACAVAEAA